MRDLRLRNGDGVLLVRLGAVGDVVRALPCLARLRDSQPDLRLGWVIEASSAPLLPGLPWLDRVFVFPRQDLRPWRLLTDPFGAGRLLTRFVSDLRAFGARIALDFQGTAKSASLGLLSGSRWRVGFDRTGSREASFLLNNVRVRPSSTRLNRVEKNLELLSALGVEKGPLQFPFAPTRPSPGVAEFLASLSRRTRVVIHPGTSLRQEHKRWPTDCFARLLGMLAETGVAPILSWGPGERGLVEEIQRLSHGAGILAPPTDLLELRQLIAGSHLFVGGDTGPMHLAWSQGIPVVALFGPTDPRINGPLGGQHRILAPAWDGDSPAPPRGDRKAIRLIQPRQALATILEALPHRERHETALPAP